VAEDQAHFELENALSLQQMTLGTEPRLSVRRPPRSNSVYQSGDTHFERKQTLSKHTKKSLAGANDLEIEQALGNEQKSGCVSL